MQACSLSIFCSQRRLCFFSCLASCGMSCRGHCVRVTCGFRCGRGPPGARSPACREPRAVLCYSSSSCWPTLCGTALWWTSDTGAWMGVTGFFLSCLSLFVNSHHATSNECNHVLQPEGCVKVFIIKRRDSGSRRGHLSDRLPSLLACFHTVQNEPQQGNPNLTKCDIWSSFLVFQRPWIKQNISSVIVYL